MTYGGHSLKGSQREREDSAFASRLRLIRARGAE